MSTTPCLEPCQRPPLPRSDVGLLRGLSGVPIEQMQHEPGCLCGSEASAEPAPRDVDDLWQPAVAIAGSVRGAQQPPPTIAVLMLFSCPRHAPTDVPCVVRRSVMAWTQSNFVEAASASPSRASAIGPRRKMSSCQGRVVWGSRPGPKHSDTRLRDVQEAAAAHRQTCRPTMAQSPHGRRHAHGQCHRRPGGRVLQSRGGRGASHAARRRRCADGPASPRLLSSFCSAGVP